MDSRSFYVETAAPAMKYAMRLTGSCTNSLLLYVTAWAVAKL